jgi:hypothetical protein
MAWAVDTQELFIGSGAVSEGAPAVSNVKVITELDLNVNGNILSLLQYIYKVSDPGMQTGTSPNIPILRPIQDRLDDSVNALDFGANGQGGSTDDTEALQRAIDQLFLNTTRSKASVDTPDGVKNRVTLEIPAGIYNISSTLYVPSYTSLVGAGANKSIINFTGTGAAIQFVNDTSEPGAPDSINNALGNTQPRYILIKDLSVWTTSGENKAFQLDAVRDSVFENLELKGNWDNFAYDNNRAFDFNVRSGIVTCENNVFKNISIDGFTHAIYTDQDILNNSFSEFKVTNCQNGFMLGFQTNTSIIGQQFGPRESLIFNSRFDNVKKYAIYIGTGSKNSIKNIKLINVGNDGAGNAQAIYPQIYIDSHGNNIDTIESDRADDLSYETTTVLLTLTGPITATKGTSVSQVSSGALGSLYRDEISSTQIRVITTSTFDTSNNIVIGTDYTPSDTGTAVHPTAVGVVVKSPYVPEVSGHATYKSFGVRNVDIGQLSGYGTAFRLPLATDLSGNPWRDISYNIDYLYRSTVGAGNFSRRGNLKVVVDVDASNILHTPIVQLTDDYEFSGSDSNEAKALALDFRAKLLQADGSYYTGAVGTTAHTLAIEYTNTLSGDSGKLLYSYTVSF